MPFAWVASFLMEGAWYRRRAWKATPSKWIAWRNSSLMCTMDGGHTWVPYMFTDEDISSRDWRRRKND